GAGIAMAAALLTSFLFGGCFCDDHATGVARVGIDSLGLVKFCERVAKSGIHLADVLPNVQYGPHTDGAENHFPVLVLDWLIGTIASRKHAHAPLLTFVKTRAQAHN